METVNKRVRLKRESLYMQIASLFAQRGTCARKAVGCTIVKDGRVISSGYNGLPKVSDTTKVSDRGVCNCDLNNPCEKAIHAEANAISFAARNGIALDGSVMFITCSPCKDCARLILQSGIYRVYYKEQYRDDSGILFLKGNNIIIEQYAE